MISGRLRMFVDASERFDPQSSDSFKLGRIGVATARYKGNWVVKGGV